MQILGLMFFIRNSGWISKPLHICKLHICKFYTFPFEISNPLSPLIQTTNLIYYNFYFTSHLSYHWHAFCNKYLNKGNIFSSKKNVNDLHFKWKIMISSPCKNCSKKNLPKKECMKDCQLLLETQNILLTAKRTCFSTGIDSTEEYRFHSHLQFSNTDDVDFVN